MIVLFLIIFLSAFIAIFLYFLSFISTNKLKNSNKMSAFECGFSPIGSIHSSFSIHFYCILLIFVVFELEVVLLLGCLFSVGSFNFLFLMFFILGGLYLEYYLGKLSWVV